MNPGVGCATTDAHFVTAAVVGSIDIPDMSLILDDLKHKLPLLIIAGCVLFDDTFVDIC